MQKDSLFQSCRPAAIYSYWHERAIWGTSAPIVEVLDVGRLGAHTVIHKPNDGWFDRMDNDTFPAQTAL